MKRTLLATLLLLAAGCTQTPPLLRGTMCLELPPEMQAEFYDAAQQWNEATDGVVDLTPGEGRCDLRVYDAPNLDDGALAQQYRHVVRVDVARIALASEVTRREAFTHELGHLFGLEHAGDHELMAEVGWGERPCVDAAALAQFCGLHGCSASAHPTCVEPVTRAR